MDDTKRYGRVQRSATNRLRKRALQRESMNDELSPVKPEEAVESYLNTHRNELADETLETRKYQLGHFVRWCGEEQIEYLSDLDGKALVAYREWRRDDGDLNNVSLRAQLSNLRQFLIFAASLDAVPEDLAEKVLLPSLDKYENRRDEKLEADRAEKILNHLRKYEYATRDHTLFKFLWRTGIRTGAVQSLDLEDYYPRKQAVEIVHRPDAGTSLKNKEGGERFIGLSDDMCEILDDYIEMRRIESSDENGREPLFTTKKGRMGKATIRRTAYRLTRPCEYAGFCPHDEDPNECDAAKSYDGASKCPDTVSAHPIRRGSITYHLLNDVPEKVVSDRMDVSGEVLSAHYDQRTEEEQMQQRREYLNNI